MCSKDVVKGLLVHICSVLGVSLKVLLEICKKLIFAMGHGTLTSAFKKVYLQTYIQLTYVIIIGV